MDETLLADSDSEEADSSSSDWYPRVLMLGPGGSKGLQMVGFLAAVDDQGLLAYVDTYCGVSVGALVSLLLISGYTIREIISEAATLDLFKDAGHLTIESIVLHQGIISNQPVRTKLTTLILRKFGLIPTLATIHQLTGKSFVTCTLDATDETTVMMDHNTHPHVSCIDATMFSMNIPYLFYQLIHEGHVYVDGALANPYPVDYFDDGETNILGIYLKVDHNPHANPIVRRVDEEESQGLSFSIYGLKMIQSVIDQRRSHIIRLSSDKCRHICLMSTTKDTTGVTLSVKDKGEMIVSGFNAGRAFMYELRNNTYHIPNITPDLKFTYPPYELQPNYD